MKTRIFLEGEDLLAFIEEHVDFPRSRESSRHSGVGLRPKGVIPLGYRNLDSVTSTEGQELQKPLVQDGDILVITSKIVALAESRTFTARDEEEKIRYIEAESTWHTRTKYVHLSIKDGMPMASAGIDESNGDGKCIMLPKNSYESAYHIWLTLREKYLFANLGIMITDSRTIPFRNGTTGISLGHAGFEGIRDYVGKLDIFGRPFHYARTNVPDALAVSAVHTMGEGDECQPLAIIRNPHVTYTDERQNGDDLIIAPEDDMYAPLFMMTSRVLR